MMEKSRYEGTAASEAKKQRKTTALPTWCQRRLHIKKKLDNQGPSLESRL
jgi:hypothetical protein